MKANILKKLSKQCAVEVSVLPVNYSWGKTHCSAIREFLHSVRKNKQYIAKFKGEKVL